MFIFRKRKRNNEYFLYFCKKLIVFEELYHISEDNRQCIPLCDVLLFLFHDQVRSRTGVSPA